jgi:hypothetical protein
MITEALDEAQKWLRGNDVDYYKGFFHENGRHKNEDSCRDELIKILRAIDPTLEYIPESHGADDKRVDILVRASASLAVPIEIKGQWHPKLWSAADEQLDDLYVNDWRAERGVFLVLWFGAGTKLTSLEGEERPTSASELCEALSARSTAAQEGRVKIVTLDMTRPYPH